VTAGEKARILLDGTAVAPAQAPVVVKLAIAAGNLIHTRPYPEPDVHYGTLAKMWPAYDCSGATSLVLYSARLMGPNALDSTSLEAYGLPGLGRWITIYANAAHARIVVAGISLDTANYGGPLSRPALGRGGAWTRSRISATALLMLRDTQRAYDALWGFQAPIGSAA
jgi:hypothetical protein